MSQEFLNHLSKHLAHAAGHERSHGNRAGANGLAFLAFGVLLLPIPFIGIPLIVIGLRKLFST